MSAFPRLARAAFAVFATLSIVCIAGTGAARADPLAPIWTGAYVGFHTGGTWGDIDVPNFANVDTSAFTVGGHAGFNLGFGALVAGVEGDLNYDGSSASFIPTGGGTGTIDTNWNGSLRGRLGLPLGPALLYATAGFAWTGKSVGEVSARGVAASADHTFAGVVYGIGAESYVLPNISLRLEALHYDYGSEKLSFSGAAAAAEDFDPSDTVVRAGVTFHLN